MDLRSLQKPLKDQYRNDPTASQIILRAKGVQTGVPVSCSVDLGRAIYSAEAHKGVGGDGAGACSGDLLLGALAACAQITCQMVAAAMAVPTEKMVIPGKRLGKHERKVDPRTLELATYDAGLPLPPVVP